MEEARHGSRVSVLFRREERNIEQTVIQLFLISLLLRHMFPSFHVVLCYYWLTNIFVTFWRSTFNICGPVTGDIRTIPERKRRLQHHEPGIVHTGKTIESELGFDVFYPITTVLILTYSQQVMCILKQIWQNSTLLIWINNGDQNHQRGEESEVANKEQTKTVRKIETICAQNLLQPTVKCSVFRVDSRLRGSQPRTRNRNDNRARYLLETTVAKHSISFDPNKLAAMEELEPITRCIGTKRELWLELSFTGPVDLLCKKAARCSCGLPIRIRKSNIRTKWKSQGTSQNIQSTLQVHCTGFFVMAHDCNKFERNE